MAYEFKPYRSIYRDPKSVEVATVLRDRYVQNFASDSLLDKSLNEMLVAAEFAGDVERAEQLKTELRNKASLRTERGDFENLGMDINMDVRQFSREYEPIRRNYEAREEDKAAKRKLVEAGRITNDMYNDWEKRSLLNYNEETGDLESYTGLQFDEDGKLVATSSYQPKTIAHQVNVDKEILNALQVLQAEQGGGRVVKVPQSMRRVDTNGDGRIDENDRAMEYMVEQKDGTRTFISEDRVRAVTQEVLNRGDVRAFMEQDADFYTYDLDESELDAMLGARAASLEAKIASGSLSQNEMAIATRSLSTLQRAMEGSVGEKRAAARGAKLDAEAERLTNMAVEAKALDYTTGGGYAIDYSAREKELWKRVQATNNQRGTVVSGGSVSAPGTPQTHQSAVRNANGEVDIEGWIATQQDNADVASGYVSENYGTLLFAPEALNTDGEGNVVPPSAESMADYLDLNTIEQVRAQLLTHAVDGKLELPDGSFVTVDAALQEIEARKNTVEHYKRMEAAAALAVENSNDTAQTNVEDFKTLDGVGNIIDDLPVSEGDFQDKLKMAELAGNVNPRTGEPYTFVFGQMVTNAEDATKIKLQTYVGLLMEDLMLEYGGGLDNPAVGNLVDFSATLMEGHLTREEVQEVFDDVMTHKDDSPWQQHNPQHKLKNARKSQRASQGSGRNLHQLMAPAIRTLEDRIETRRANIMEATEGNATYPVWNVPPYADEDAWKDIEQIHKDNPTNLINRQSAIEAGDGTYLQVSDALAQQGMSPGDAQITSIQATYMTGADGRPTEAFVVNFKGPKNGGSGNTVASVIVPPQIVYANGQGIQGTTDLGTLDEEVLKTAYQIHNTFPGETGRTGKVTVPFNDGGLNLLIRFDAMQGAAVEGAAPSFDLTSGYIYISGTKPDGQPVAGTDAKGELRLTFAQYQKVMRDYGVLIGRTADVQWNSARAQQSAGAQYAVSIGE